MNDYMQKLLKIKNVIDYENSYQLILNKMPN